MRLALSSARLSASLLALLALPAVGSIAGAQNTAGADNSRALHWRTIGPTRAGRARALAGVPSQPNVFYIGFDNGGVWRSTDYGSTWHPLFDNEPTGSIGAIAVSPSDPKVIYVGTGAGIIRPDLAVGDGVYKSTDGGKTWTHLGLHDTQMIAMIDVDPTNPNRIFVAALGHPYGPNAERGIFRSTDGGQTFQKVLYKDEYTSGNDVRIDPSNPNTVYATLWQQQQSFIEGGAFGAAGGANGIYKSTDGGTTWTQLSEGLPPVVQANLGISASKPGLLYATVAGMPENAGGGGRGGGRGGANPTTGVVGFYKSTDGGAHWTKVGNDPRPLARIGGGDLPTIAVDPKNENVVYSASTVSWRTEDGGQTWSAVRGAPGGDDYQKIWINPINPDILLVVSDQGGVVSANRGASWSNWYTQPTAAMYHVSTDNAFPYDVCGGQQDSGSACVASLSMDGEITFHDWHPVNIQEYGVAAPDPKNPDMVYGSARTGVSLYNRKTGQTTQVGPSAEQRGTLYGRNVRTMPIQWSSVDNNTLFYTSNVVWKSTDRAHSWTRISPDLTRQTWAVPANAGKYASSVTPGPQGTLTAMSPSPRDINVIWTGSDDGTISVTFDGGKTWKNVTPPSVKPWARVFNIEAGHFDTQTAYAAVNTFRLDDLSPHFFRTHDGGKTWTEINNGITDKHVSNSIREDPRTKGLLFAATDLGVWASFDDGANWRSIKFDMPAISVRDIQIKDDSTCMCSDLVAGTHGRGFWILDDITPLRQFLDAQAAQQKGDAFLFKPATALRVRFATNDPTPWPPELPAGENPLPGGIIDYNLAKGATDPVKLEIVDAAGKVVRHYSSADPVRNPHPALDPEAYDRLCKQNPSAPDCGLPLYWPAPPIRLSTGPGFHRFSWDLRLDQLGAEDPNAAEDDAATGAVPHRTYAVAYAPWAPPGKYTVRLTVDGKTYTQPLTLKLDPRVKTPAAGLAQLEALTKEMYDGAKSLHAAFNSARALSAQLDAAGADAASLKAQVDQLAPAPAAGGRGRGRGGFGGGRGGPPSNTPPSLETVSNELYTAAMSMQGADVTPTAGQVAAVAKARADAADAMKRWNAANASLSALNAKRKAAGQPPISVPAKP